MLFFPACAQTAPTTRGLFHHLLCTVSLFHPPPPWTGCARSPTATAARSINQNKWNQLPPPPPPRSLPKQINTPPRPTPSSRSRRHWLRLIRGKDERARAFHVYTLRRRTERVVYTLCILWSWRGIAGARGGRVARKSYVIKTLFVCTHTRTPWINKYTRSLCVHSVHALAFIVRRPCTV